MATLERGGGGGASACPSGPRGEEAARRACAPRRRSERQRCAPTRRRGGAGQGAPTRRRGGAGRAEAAAGRAPTRRRGGRVSRRRSERQAAGVARWISAPALLSALGADLTARYSCPCCHAALPSRRGRGARAGPHGRTSWPCPWTRFDSQPCSTRRSEGSPEGRAVAVGLRRAVGRRVAAPRRISGGREVPVPGARRVPVRGGERGPVPGARRVPVRGGERGAGTRRGEGCRYAAGYAAGRGVPAPCGNGVRVCVARGASFPRVGAPVPEAAPKHHAGKATAGIRRREARSAAPRHGGAR